MLDKLEQLDILDKTIVLFWSDHGEFLGDYGVTHKMAAFYDSMVRIPMVLWDPSGQVPRGANRDLVEAADIFATMLDLCGIPQPNGSRACSLMQQAYEPRVDVYAEGGLQLAPEEAPIAEVNLRAPHGPTHFGAGAMLRTERWKLCVHSFDRWELYDMENDPVECRNIYEDPQHAQVVRELTQRLMARMMNYGQAPEHLPHPKATGVDETGMPVWDRNYDAIELRDGFLP